MSAIEFKNAKGQVRYQPVHPDGRRLNVEGWERVPNRKLVLPSEPRLYRTKRRAYRQVSKLIERENRYYHERFKEAK